MTLGTMDTDWDEPFLNSDKHEIRNQKNFCQDESECPGWGFS